MGGVTMNGNTAPNRRRRLGLLVAAVLSAGPLLAACSGSHSSAGGSPSRGGSRSASLVAYAACIRSHGVPNYPDPDSSGELAKTDAHQLGVSTSEYQAAQDACRHLVPTGGSLMQREHQCMQDSDCTPEMVQRMLTADRKLARCMRSHGVANFPDPTTDSDGPVFNITAAGISDRASHSDQFIHGLTRCERVVANNPVPPPESFE